MYDPYLVLTGLGSLYKIMEFGRHICIDVIKRLMKHL
jgi:hypothetical protein